MTAAVQHQLQVDFCPLWDRTVPQLYVATSETQLAPDDALVVILDDADQAGYLGYHDETPQGRVYARVFAGACLDQGGQVLTGKGSVASCLSHEILELLIDRTCGAWVDGPDGEIAMEVCDPCQDDVVEYDLAGIAGKVSLSSFVLPSWFDPHATGRVDFLGSCAGPFRRSAGGYVICRSEPGDEHTVGAMRAWHASPASRTARRGVGA